MTARLLGSDFTTGDQLPNYVNGRLLTAEDLATGQATLLAREARLGEAAGHGVVRGLWVSANATSLVVAPGLGVAPDGEPVQVGTQLTLSLVGTPVEAAPVSGASFSSCCATSTSTPNLVTGGCYLLAAAPACALSGSAPLAGSPGDSAPAGCTAQWQVEGVQLFAISLPLGTEVAGIEVTSDNRRNLLAHWCFGTAALADLPTNPFTFDPAYGGFDTLTDLTAGMLPLAVFCWDGQSVAFVDNWSARRRMTGPDPVTASWSAVVADRRPADGMARFLQFQDQAADLVASGAAGGVEASDVFPLLPPVGFLQISAKRVSKVFTHVGALNDVEEATRRETLAERFAAVGSASGFDPTVFFDDLARYGGIIEWDVADLLLRQSWERAPQPMSAGTIGVVGVPVTIGLPTDAGAVPAADQLDVAAPLTLYLVESAVSSFTRKVQVDQARRSLSSIGVTAYQPPVYVVFVRNYHWWPRTLPPILSVGTDDIQGNTRTDDARQA